MIVGVPKEIKTHEYRVALMPVGVEELRRAGNKVLIQGGAGQGSGISDEQYAKAGAEIVADRAEIWAARRPDRQGQGAAAGRVAADAPGQIVFTYFHFAADETTDAGRACIRHHRHRLRDDPRTPRAACRC